ncbi:hypothetical protein D9757_000624 [Collybiopsis confluens]|uniref:Csf1 N-terminal domain-containing protein n=1 Tax=Collybiopsis confluens TaxID=2823264 RepID=A0A8H5MGR7_9AGAR|nr:hypothetical protein D9757_000624 [Collybiopsis confluens]
MFNVLLLIVCVVIAAGAFVYFFYFNRFIAWLIGLIIRLVYWNNGASSIWLEIGSIHFSILSGRILFKDIRYHSSNQTAKIVKAQIAWRYWIRRPTTEEEIGLSLGGEDSHPSRDSSCRLQISFQGFEWFIYNRTAAYDNILARTKPQSSERCTPFQKVSNSNTPVASLFANSFRSRAPTFIKTLISRIREQLPNLDPKDLLPLGIQVSKGAIICGNPSTPNLLVAEFKRMEGTFGIVPSRSKYDFYKQMLTLRFSQALIHFEENEHYRGPMTSTGEVIEDQIDNYELKTASARASYPTFIKVWEALKLYTPVLKYLSAYQSSKSRQGSHRPKRSKKSMDEDTPVGADFSKFEYAIERKILETSFLELCYYADVVGVVPQTPAQQAAPVDPFDIGNGDFGPEWGVDVAIHGGVLKYGPWADRQRGELQRAFFPPMFSDAEMTSRLRSGDQRLWTAMRVFIELRGETSLHNWQWDGLNEPVERPRKREPALLHLTVGDRSSISYLMPMVASERGYEPILEAHLDTVSVTSSVNDIPLVSAESCRIHCDLPSPLQWNEQRTWNVSVTLRRPTLYLIRDHINMFTDLGKDWSSGPPHDYQRFIPMVYGFELDMHHYELYLYSNDQNIIDKPLIDDENALFSLVGERMKFSTIIHSNVYRAESTTIPLLVDVPDVVLKLSLPRWNTNALHAPKSGNTIARVGSFSLQGSYLYFAEVHRDHIEQFVLNIKVRGIIFKSLGWAIRHFMILRDNYLGSFTHFSTLYEYLDRRKRGVLVGDPVVQKYRPGSSNMMQVQLGVVLSDGIMILPAGLPGYEKGIDVPGEPKDSIGHCLVLCLPEVDLQLRLHDLYMEMTLNMGTICGSFEEHFPESLVYPDFKSKKSQDALVLDGIDIVANRLFGPVPRTITYACLWEICLGSVKASLSASQAAVLQAAGRTFGINFTDPLNALADDYQSGVYPDVTFVKVSAGSIDLLWKAGSAAALLSVPGGFKLDHNDLGGKYHKKSTSIRLPQLVLKTLLDYNETNTWLEAAEVVTDVFLDIYSSPAGWQEMSTAQADFVWEQDQPTGRIAQFIQMLKTARSTPETRTHMKGVYIPQPTLLHHKAYSQHKYGHRRQSHVGPTAEIVQSSESENENPQAFEDVVRSTPRPIPRILSESSSAGDESDNEDLTDHSDTEWPDSDSDVDTEARPYFRFVKHHMLHHGDSPALWEDGAFVLIRGARFPFTKIHANKNSPDQAFSPLTFPDNSKSTVVYRISQSDGLEVKVTPLAISVLEKLQADIDREWFSPEYLTDRWLSSYISDFPNPAKPSAQKCIVLDISLESATVHVLRRLGAVAGTAVDKIESPSRFAYMMFNASSLRFFGDLGSERKSLAIQVGNARVDLTALSNDGRVAMKHSAFTFLAENFMAASSRDSTKFSCTNLRTDITQSFPVLAVAIINSTKDDIPRLSRVYKQAKERSSNSVRSTIYHILQSSSDDMVIDPLSTIQPSFLVQIGLPQELRANPTFRFLFHLRNCLWHLRENDPFWDKELTQQVTVDDLKPLLKERLLSLDPEVYHVSNLGPIEPLIPNINPLTAWKKDNIEYPFSYVSIKLDFIDMRIDVLENRPPCRITFSDTVTDLRLQHYELLDDSSESRRQGMSQTSLRSNSQDRVQGISVYAAFGDIQITVYSYIMNFIQEVLRVRKLFASSNSATKKEKKARFEPFNIIRIHAVLLLKRLQLRAIAEMLTFEFGLSEIRHSATVLLYRHSRKLSMVHSLLLSEVFIKARATHAMTDPNENDELASLVVGNSALSTVMRRDTFEQSMKVAFSLGALRFTVPRSALRLYRFVEQWRADFLPGIETTLQSLMSEIDKPAGKRSRPAIPSSQSSLPKSLTLRIDGRVACAGIYLRVMHDTWMSWEINDTFIHLNSVKALRSSYDFGVGLASQIFAISTDSPDASSQAHVKLEFPSFLLSGHFNESSIRIMSVIRRLDLKVKPSYWDTILAVQQKFGQDFNDLLSVVQQTRTKRSQTSQSSQAPSPSSARTEISVFAKMEGFRIGFEGRSSVLYLECPGIRAKFEGEPERAWSVTVTDLALSLAPRSSVKPQSFGFDRHKRSAFVIIDFKVLSKSRASKGEVLEVAITKIHAVMQPSSIGEMGDFIDDLQMEMADRREHRAQELLAFKQKTQQLIQTFELKTQEPAVPSRGMSWLSRYIIQFSLSSIGVAFPLAHDHDMELPPAGSHDSAAVRAFLFSIKSVKFGTQHGETGQASMDKLSFQFVSRFRQSVPADFSGENHSTRNRLTYPTMKAQLRSSKSPTSNEIHITSTVSGFILHLDSTIPDYVFSLFDVYRHGRERVQKLSANLPRGIPDSFDTIPLPNKQKSYSSATPEIFASLTFLSGQVRVYSTIASPSSHFSRARNYSGTWDRVEPVGDVEAEVFDLPEVSVWTEYRTAPSSTHLSPNQPESPVLIFKSTVHSSQNILRPTLLPFITEVVTLVEARLHTSSNRADSLSSPVERAVEPEPEPDNFSPPSAIRISFSLRIDQSRLEFTCLPDVNVVAALHWNSGGFMINVLPGARDVIFTGTVGGLTVGLKHGFLSEDCLKLDARNLAFSVTFGKRWVENGSSLASVSLVCDTELLGGVRFSRLQDILCFKAVWLDRIPVFYHDTVIEDVPSKPSIAISASTPKPEFITAILVRIRQIKLDIDLGQSISTVDLRLENTVLRSKFTQLANELSLRVNHMSIVAKGNVAGHADVSDCVFQTIRWVADSSSRDDSRDCMLELRMTSGPLIVMLESDYQKLLHYRAEPLEVEISDDWSIPKSSQTDRPLRLSFTVKSPEVVAVATVGTIPKLLAYANKFKANLEAQKEGASRESNTFRISQSPKPENPLSAVAEAMINSARTRFKEADVILSYMIQQHMSLRLDSLRLVVFPRAMGDPEVAQFLGQDVRGRLHRLVESVNTSSRRGIRFSFSSMKISRFTQLGHAVLPPSSEISDGRQWLEDLLKDATGADIVGLPSMIMNMTSEESKEGLRKVLSYDFDSKFVRRTGMQHSEDIYITLNVALYAWLTVMRKTLTREMDQVQTVADWRNYATGPAPSRKKVPEPLGLAEASRFATIPQPSSKPPLTPAPPKSASLLSPTFSFSPDLLTSPQPPLAEAASPPSDAEGNAITYRHGRRNIERLTMRQLGEATPDVMHPFFMKKAGFSLEDSLPQYVHEYATAPLEQIMEVLLKLYSRQLLAATAAS